MARRAVCLVALALLAPGPASGARGVAIDVGRIEITQELTPGGTYRLPTFGVRNPGDQPTRYRMGASAVVDPDRRAVPAGWFEFSPRELVLDPGETGTVRARLDVPTDADPGDYIGLVGAQIAPAGKGAEVGAAAAARTTFTVEPASTLAAWWLELKTFLRDHAPWTWLVPLLVTIAAGLRQARRRMTITIARRT